ncbi:hypothetical protein ACSHT0_06485 [Tepidicaulis sp. LMO-SS28]|uniref:hypothetical protein n=1 Tax=Tepidicaulis sp. LMO-SS28 TaxID=3447455 RepID=UPI003EE376F6
MAFNIDKFNEQAARLFAHLYESFPEPVDCAYAELLGDLEEKRSDEPLEWLEVDEQFARSTMSWLVNEDFIDAQGFDTAAMRGAVLTSKGLQILNAVPVALQTQASIGDELKDAVKQGARDKIKELVGKILGASITVAIDNMPG